MSCAALVGAALGVAAQTSEAWAASRIRSVSPNDRNSALLRGAKSRSPARAGAALPLAGASPKQAQHAFPQQRHENDKPDDHDNQE